jgi:crotonobetainyl-CoA:carnitine CoA-transferase CaiB-like acyl-CoA transferase
MDGMRVLDLTRLLPGGLTTQLLVDLGAEVIKVEQPGKGDYLREMARNASGLSPVFFLLNQGKKSLTVNLKEPEGQGILHRLIPTADVLIEQFRPGVAAELGVDYETAGALRTDLVYCSFSGFGAQGPYRNRPGHDINYLALAGGLHAGAQREPTLSPVPAVDVSSGFLAAFAIVGALLERERSGEGHYLDLSLFDAALYLSAVGLTAGETFLTGTSPGYGLYATADGRVLSLGALERRFWRRLCRAIERPDLIDADLEQEEEAQRVHEILRETFLTRSAQEWDDLLQRHDVPAAPVASPSEVLQDPHVRAMHLLREVEEGGEPMLSLAHPTRWREGGPDRKGKAPRLGEHTREILEGLGYGTGTIAEWDRVGVVDLPRS